MKHIKPITPQEIPKQKAKCVPAFVIEAVNELLVQKYAGSKNSVTLYQDEIISEAMSVIKKHDIMTSNLPTKNDFFEKGWLNFEVLFDEAGWIVDYRAVSQFQDRACFTFVQKPVK